MEGISYLVADFEVQCYVAVHIWNMVLASLVVLGLGFGLPFSIFLSFERNEHAHKHRQISFLVGRRWYVS